MEESESGPYGGGVFLWGRWVCLPLSLFITLGMPGGRGGGMPPGMEGRSCVYILLLLHAPPNHVVTT